MAASFAQCGGRRETLLTYYNGEYGVSLRYPSFWKTEQARQEGVWNRRFLGPPVGSPPKPAVVATLLVASIEGSLEEFAQSYLKGNTVASSREETRAGARGRSFLFRSKDGATRYSLLLLREDDRVYGLHAQGEAPLFERHFPVLEEMAKSLALERPASYPEQRNDKFGFAIRIPPSWHTTRDFSGGGTLLRVFQSPPLAAEGGRQTVHASLNLTVERIPEEGGLEGYYATTRQRLGETALVLNHGRWKDGYVDVMRVETPLAVSRVKRFYRIDKDRGYSLSFEAREDLHPRVAGWYDGIASTLRTQSELDSK